MDATTRNRILLGLGLLIVLVLAFSLDARATSQTADALQGLRDHNVNPSAAKAKATQRDLLMHRVARGYQEKLDEDGTRFALQPTSPEELGRPNKYEHLIVDNVVLKIGQQFTSPWVTVKAVTERVAYQRGGAEVRANHSIAFVTNVHDTPIAYYLDARSADLGGCEVRGSRRHNANALLPGERAEIAVCAGSKPIELHDLQVMEVTPLGYNYVSMIPPRALGHDETTGQAHYAGRRHKVCSQIPSERLSGALREEAIAWRDVVDFFSRHNCHRYPWLWAYRYAPEGVAKLPVERRNLQGADAPVDEDGAVEAAPPETP